MHDDMEMADRDEVDGGDQGDRSNDEAPVSQPFSMEEDSAIARRRAIQQIIRDNTIGEQEKRMRTQALMSGERTEMVQRTAPVLLQPEGNSACVHYERNCNIVAPCCNRIFGCRFCHDDLSPPDHPPMNRFLVREVVCKLCSTRQAAGNQCINCHIMFGKYHCNLCNLWMSSSKKPFHCMQCGFCRVGGANSFRHCNECNNCISVTIFDTHQCFKVKYNYNCPLCQEDMISPHQPPLEFPCGHAVHAHCFRKLVGYDYRCPLCKKAVVPQQSLAAAWKARARKIAKHPMPSDPQHVVDIMCNDCEAKSHGHSWHSLGIQCPHCNSFNTVVEQVVSSGL